MLPGGNTSGPSLFSGSILQAEMAFFWMSTPAISLSGF
jgi:hypothetical protein